MGLNYFFLIDDEESHAKVSHFSVDAKALVLFQVDGYPERVIHVGSFYGEFFFNFVFAATAATITSGAVAERVKLSAYFGYSLILTGFVQPITVHWTWSNGFLLYPSKWFQLPETVFFRDYAGGMSVHAVGGLAALVGCGFIGPRIGKYQAGKHYHLPGHSTPLTGLGGFILITGFLGMVLGHGSNIELSSTNIFLGGAVAGCTATSYKFVKPFIVNFKRRSRRNSKIKKTYWSFLVLVDSCLCGMVALCAGANVVEPYAAACIGFVSALVFLGIEDLIKRNELDDPLGSIARVLIQASIISFFL